MAYLIVLTFSSALVGDKLQRSNSSEAPSLWQPCSGKKRHLNPLSVLEKVCLLLQLELVFFWPRKKKRGEGMLKPLWNYACKHRRCITQVMRFSSLLKFESPPAPKENKQSPFPTFSFRKMQNATFASSPAPFLPRLLLPTCESGQAVCMQIYCLDDPRPHAHTHTHTGVLRWTTQQWLAKEILLSPGPHFRKKKYCVYSATGPTSYLLSCCG